MIHAYVLIEAEPTRCTGYFMHPRHVSRGGQSCGTTIVVMEPPEDRKGDNAPCADTGGFPWR